MILNLKKTVMVGIIALMFMVSSTVGAFAHGLHMHGTDHDVTFEYDDGTPLKQAIIIVQDESGEKIAEGKTDDNGTYDFSEVEGAVKVVVNDANGHQEEYVIGEEAQAHDHEEEDHEEEAHAEEEADHDHDEEEHAEEASTEDSTEEEQSTETKDNADETSTEEGSSQMVTVGIVVVALLAVAGIFYTRNKKK